MLRSAIIALALAGTAAAADARLVSQRLAGGGNRVCLYEVRRLPGQSQTEQMRVGMGERCPARYRRPQPPGVPQIPADARLDRVQRIGGRTVCTYSRFGRYYSRALPPNATCPQTAGVPG